MIKFVTVLCALALGQAVQAESVLVKLASPNAVQQTVSIMNAQGLKAQAVLGQWIEVSGDIKLSQFKGFLESSAVVHAQKNYKIQTYENPAITQLRNNPEALAKWIAAAAKNPIYTMAAKDNPAIPSAPSSVAAGADPLFSQQWGMNDIGVVNAWSFSPINNDITVAVIDTGVDYTHEDLVQNMWRNPREVENGVDDDNNGYVDDIVGWDFIDKDNKPYDLKSSFLAMITTGGNPGHGTHCAGNVAATANNGKGVVGVAPKAKIMALRFIGNQGGSTADAVLAIRYAVDNGAKVLSNSWGSMGEDPNDTAGNLALREAVQYAMDHNVLFIAAAGNGRMGIGYDNDTDKEASMPASYPHDNIIAVAAIDSSNNLGKFSNWGVRTVDIGAPGVKVMSTTVGGKYDDSLRVPYVGIALAGWDGTSMATPHVAGAAALYWSVHPNKSWQEVKAAILASAKPVSTLQGKVMTNGKLSVEELMKR